MANKNCCCNHQADWCLHFLSFSLNSHVHLMIEIKYASRTTSLVFFVMLCWPHYAVCVSSHLLQATVISV